ncbi:hypothetical protein [[Phormidium] sp. ETS-05]|uniref:hypothetical protein n=1 Tax=[Phormidium] sp. ETS-05 TaxID=222819 RepID=UPI0018EF3088|nr:hypothetical protein [[Phormidium] sp. ETS-05]
MNIANGIQLLSVSEFFGSCNWQGRPLVNQENGYSQDPQSLWQLPVAEYFRSFPWEGTPTVGELPKGVLPATPTPPESEDVTLEDFLDAF